MRTRDALLRSKHVIVAVCAIACGLLRLFGEGDAPLFASIEMTAPIVAVLAMAQVLAGIALLFFARARSAARYLKAAA